MPSTEKIEVEVVETIRHRVKIEVDSALLDNAERAGFPRTADGAFQYLEDGTADLGPASLPEIEQVVRDARGTHDAERRIASLSLIDSARNCAA